MTVARVAGASGTATLVSKFGFWNERARTRINRVRDDPLETAAQSMNRLSASAFVRRPRVTLPNGCARRYGSTRDTGSIVGGR
jgi:hypothetical protein